ncbi:MAG TPA: AsmA-like C-terminal region-containing protein [Bdellovibrionota bacterium]|nr:AsmA-like C-terminal region-containing protein [Bdellovibrionota bacterium]
MPKGKVSIKKIAIIAGIVVALFIVIAAILPFVIKIDHFRPKIVEMINKKISGRVELGEMHLRVLGGLGANIDGVTVFGSKLFGEKPILIVKEATIKASLLSLITKRPDVSIVLTNPALTIERNSEGVWNIFDLVGEKEKRAEVEEKKEEEKKGELPQYLRNAKLSLELEDADASLDDKKSGIKTSVKNLDLALYDIALDSPIKFRISLDATGKYKKYVIEGPLSTEGEVLVDWRNNQIADGVLDAIFNCEDAMIEMKGTFSKKAGISCQLEIDSKIENNVALIKKASLKFHTLEADLRGKISDITTNPIVDLKIEMSPLKLKEWHEILTPLQGSPISAMVALNGSMKGPLVKPEFFADLKISDGSGRISGIKPSISNLKGDISVEGENIQIKNISFLAGKSSVQMRGTISDISHPYFNLDLNSPSINVTEIFGGTAPAPKAGGEAPKKGGAAGSRGGETLGFLNAYQGKGRVRVGHLGVGKTVLSDFNADLTLGGGNLTVSQTASLFGGSIQSTTSLNASGGYHLKGSVKNMDLVTMAKNYGSNNPSLKGALQGSLDVSGSGTSMASIKQNLKGGGSLAITNGELADLNVGRQVQAALATISALSGAPIQKKEFDRKFQRISADVSIGGGRIQTNNAFASTSEIEMVGKGFATLDQALNFQGDVHIPPEFVAIRGLDIRDKTGKVPIPFYLTGTVSNPKFSLDVAKLAAYIAIKFAEQELKKRILGVETKPGEGSPTIPGLPFPVPIPGF